MTDKNSLQHRLDTYINSEYCDPLAVGLISELRAHLRAANKGAEFMTDLAYKRFLKTVDLEKRIQKLEEVIDSQTEKGREK